MIKSLLKRIDLDSHPSRKRATILQAIGGYIDTSIVIIQGLVLVPLFLYYIGAHTYGIWLASGGILGMLGLMNFGISNLLVQRIAREYSQQNLSGVSAYFINGLIIYIGISFLYALLGWVISIWLPGILNVTGADAKLLVNCFQIAILAMVINIFNECLRSFCQAILRPVLSMVSMLAGRVLGIVITIWMLIAGFGLWSIPIGMLVGEGMIFVFHVLYVLLLIIKLETKISLSLNIIKEYWKSSPILLMARLGDTVSQEAEPFLITVFLSPELTTAYMVTRRAADIVFRLLNIVAGSTMGSFAHLAGSGNNIKTTRVAKKLLIISFSIGVIGFATYVGVNHAFVSLWVGEPFVLEQNIILFIALGLFSRNLRGLLGHLLYGVGDFVYPSIITLIEGFVRVFLTVLLLSVTGLMGVPLSLMLSSTIAMIILGLRLKRELAMHINYFNVVRVVFSGLVLFGVSTSMMFVGVNINSWFDFVLYSIVILAVVLVVFVLMNLKWCQYIYKNIVSRI